MAELRITFSYEGTEIEEQDHPDFRAVKDLFEDLTPVLTDLESGDKDLDYLFDADWFEGEGSFSGRCLIPSDNDRFDAWNAVGSPYSGSYSESLNDDRHWQGLTPYLRSIGKVEGFSVEVTFDSIQVSQGYHFDGPHFYHDPEWLDLRPETEINEAKRESAEKGAKRKAEKNAQKTEKLEKLDNFKSEYDPIVKEFAKDFLFLEPVTACFQGIRFTPLTDRAENFLATNAVKIKKSSRSRKFLYRAKSPQDLFLLLNQFESQSIG